MPSSMPSSSHSSNVHNKTRLCEINLPTQAQKAPKEIRLECVRAIIEQILFSRQQVPLPVTQLRVLLKERGRAEREKEREQDSRENLESKSDLKEGSHCQEQGSLKRRKKGASELSNRGKKGPGENDHYHSSSSSSTDTNNKGRFVLVNGENADRPLSLVRSVDTGKTRNPPNAKTKKRKGLSVREDKTNNDSSTPNQPDLQPAGLQTFHPPRVVYIEGAKKSSKSSLKCLSDDSNIDSDSDSSRNYDNFPGGREFFRNGDTRALDQSKGEQAKDNNQNIEAFLEKLEWMLGRVESEFDDVEEVLVVIGEEVELKKFSKYCDLG
jgi:hypothetical protein